MPTITQNSTRRATERTVGRRRGVRHGCLRLVRRTLEDGRHPDTSRLAASTAGRAVRSARSSRSTCSYSSRLPVPPRYRTPSKLAAAVTSASAWAGNRRTAADAELARGGAGEADQHLPLGEVPRDRAEQLGDRGRPVAGRRGPRRHIAQLRGGALVVVAEDRAGDGAAPVQARKAEDQDRDHDRGDHQHEHDRDAERRRSLRRRRSGTRRASPGSRRRSGRTGSAARPGTAAWRAPG